MIPMTLSQLNSQLLGQHIGQDLTIKSISTDSRKLPGADLFLALKGERFDAHDYIKQAIENGAKSAVLSRSMNIKIPYLIVENTHIALGQIASLQRRASAARFVGLTGSVGKTSVKEMLASILSLCGNTLATRGNLNNEIGVPLTLCDLNNETEYAVIEMGANHAGEIDYTSEIVKPHVALINNVAAAHLEGFGSLHGIARAKGEIYSNLQKAGTAIVNVDDKYAQYWLKNISQDIVTFGQLNNADITARNIEVSSSGLSFQLIDNLNQTSIGIKMDVPGRHNIMNALAAAATCIALNIQLEKVAQGLERYQGISGRLQVSQYNNVTLIDDSYNANYASLAAAIDVLKQQSGYKIIALGDMAELGSSAREYHEMAGRYAKEQGINELLTIGELSFFAAEAFGNSAKHFSLRDELIDYIKHIEKEHVSILLKGSRSAQMEKIAQALAPRSINNNKGDC